MILKDFTGFPFHPSGDCLRGTSARAMILEARLTHIYFSTVYAPRGVPVSNTQRFSTFSFKPLSPVEKKFFIAATAAASLSESGGSFVVSPR